MVDVSYQMVLSTLQTVGLLVGIFYYVTILRNAQKNRMIDMVFQRMQETNPDYHKMARSIAPMMSGWDTVEEFYEKYNYEKTPELVIARTIYWNNLSSWGFLLREGAIKLDFINRLHAPWVIIRNWEKFESLFLDNRERMDNPEYMKDFEFLYDAVKKRYPRISADTRFTFQEVRGVTN